MSACTFTALVIARLHAGNVPRLALADIGGRPLALRVAQRLRASRARRIVLVTDSEQVLEAAHRHDAEAVRVADHGPSTLSCLGEACAKLHLPENQAVVAVPGADLFVAPGLADELAQALRADPQAAAAVGARPVRDMMELLNPCVVKVVFDDLGRANYLSRAPIPWPVAAGRHAGWSLPQGHRAWRCVTSVTAWRAGTLVRLGQAPQHALERTEELELLRALGRGVPVTVATVAHADMPPIDSLEDLEMARAAWLTEQGQT